MAHREPAVRRPPRRDTLRRWTANALVRNLERFVTLGHDERGALAGLTTRLVPYAPRAEVVEPGAAPPRDVIIVSGYACRYKLRPDGDRQILQILMPGEICHCHAHLHANGPHPVGALTEVYAAKPPRDALTRAAERHPAIARALSWAALAERSILLERIAAAGRPAESRLAHLLCELSVRMTTLGLAAAPRAVPPLSQVQLAQALGLTAVHLNRLVQKLRREGLIELAHRGLAILDFERLQTIGEFDAAYLRPAVEPAGARL
jgi:CRP-like cAMP-binding protein